MQTKSEQRKLIRQRLESLTAYNVEHDSLAMCRAFLESDLYLKSNVVMAYIAMTTEANPSNIIERAIKDGKTVAVPMIDWQNKVINPARLKSITKGLKKNDYGIFEPEEFELVDPCSIEVVIVPGLGFDLNGNRLGRGGGYYDKFFANKKLKAIKCGFAFDCQILDKITTTPTDIVVDALTTPSLVRRFA